MSYKIFFTPFSNKQFMKLPKETQLRIKKALDRMRIRPKSFAIKLVSLHLYRFRVGDYRVIMEIDDTRIIILVVGIGHRKVIYKYNLTNK